MSGADRIYDAAFAQAGVIRARDMDDFFHIAKGLSAQPPAAGDGIAILTDAGGPGVMAADECETRGIAIRVLSDETLQKFEKLKEEQKIPKFAANLNPVDLTGSATSEMYELAAKILLDDPGVHALIVIGLHHAPGLGEDFIDKTYNVVRQYRKPVTACDIGETEMAMYVRSRFDKLGIPSYSSPEDAARAIVALIRYGLYLRKEGCYGEYLANMEHKNGRRTN